ncbi:MAG: 5-oxoprolinase subunit PxpB [Pseudohongiella sp.]|nr:5-oxoprolinase subunit PxpB [Pseudohongiella sp.]MDO9520765.1 5-oxoprolinase subunit PxpB [Pseudohongiella sp.]MDP2126950.1 5-oxoprolinase subunit PxpB [Pseudohongiella sp.]
MNIPDPVISFVTENGILLEFAPPESISVDTELQQRLCHLSRLLREHSHTGPLLCDIVTAPGSLLLLLHDGRTARRLLRHSETLWHASAQKVPDQVTITIPVVYGGESGPDLEAAADLCGLSAQTLVEKHLDGEYLVQCLGFMPGFAYLAGLDPALHIPRKSSPSTRIPAGSVAIAGSHTGVYPSSTPGGWHVIGRTSLTLFDPRAAQPCLMQPGDRVRFVVQGGHLS